MNKDKRKIRHLEDRLAVIQKRLEKYPDYADIFREEIKRSTKTVFDWIDLDE